MDRRSFFGVLAAPFVAAAVPIREKPKQKKSRLLEDVKAYWPMENGFTYNRNASITVNLEPQYFTRRALL